MTVAVTVTARRGEGREGCGGRGGAAPRGRGGGGRRGRVGEGGRRRRREGCVRGSLERADAGAPRIVAEPRGARRRSRASRGRRLQRICSASIALSPRQSAAGTRAGARALGPRWRGRGWLAGGGEAAWGESRRARGGAEGEGWGRGERWRAAGVAARTVQRWQPRPAGTARRARQAARHGNRGNASSAGAWALTAAVSGRQRSASAAVGPPLATTTPSAAAKHAAGRRSAARERRLTDERRGDRAIRPRRSSAARAALDAPCEAAHAVERCRQRRRRRRS